MSTKTKISLKSATAAKKIESPLAKYNSTGQLFCVVCNAQVKNEMFWTGHINGKAHRDQVILLKSKGVPSAGSSSSSSISLKRSATVSSTVANSDGNGISSTSGNFGNGDTYLAPISKRVKLDEINISPMGPPPTILKKSTLTVQPPKKKTYKEIEDEEALMDIDNDNSSISISSSVDNGDSYNNEDDDDDDEDQTEPKPVTESLPAGFFDDAKEDAKARGLEYKNPDEAEWDKFVKEIASEDVKSSALRTADEEDSAKDRELDEIEEQMKNWQRVVELERKAKEAKRKLLQENEMKSEKMSTSDDEDVDDEYDDDLDWRTKKKN